MIEPSLLLAAVCGGVLATSPVLLVAGRRQPPVRLSDALDRLSGADVAPLPSAQLSPDAGRLDRAGARLAAGRLGRVSQQTRRALALRGRSLGDFMIEKCVWALAGLMLPLLAAAAARLAGLNPPATPVLAAMALGLAGWFLPDLRLRSGRRETRQDAAEAVLSFIDLVTLARLANESASRALTDAAQVSDHAVMIRIRATLERARLEQQAPWNGLERLAEDLDLPELAELVEVLRLDDQGAALAGTLRARAVEMRDAHLTREKIAAQETSESMTVWMVVPVLVLGLVLLTPPLLRLSGLAP
ncbi:hypothetical protein DUY81_01160 [Acidipropionibacterium acidipropionici]|uniref:Type II secretion system F family protein n=1 Tax=Acidipropionibacterium acidipropionici TaxID=1748 RepID=A0AAC8YFP1_9ACTN|nr:hypothetical protein [Acidipropionibacterium acidipropionici]AMS05821.1 hypothetical protein AXH35_10590 [Acidipropionibacterium acidipropionici]AOZ47288.1 hypothetical protein A8L58_12030 [Acidipropionibacterium acidipropionici]AZP36606.1 hypothetical protein DUY81_01160 [Acidipropionibacterium acidipropionici]